MEEYNKPTKDFSKMTEELRMMTPLPFEFTKNDGTKFACFVESDFEKHLRRLKEEFDRDLKRERFHEDYQFIYRLVFALLLMGLVVRVLTGWAGVSTHLSDEFVDYAVATGIVCAAIVGIVLFYARHRHSTLRDLFGK